jgi:hypothetical protein
MIQNTNSQLTLHDGDSVSRSFMGSQKYWQKQGMRMMRLEDLYRLLGSLAKKQLISLRKEIKGAFLFTSQLDYNDGMVSVDGREPVACPVYDSVRISEVDEAVLQYLFNTKDSKDAITFIKTFS